MACLLEIIFHNGLFAEAKVPSTQYFDMVRQLCQLESTGTDVAGGFDYKIYKNLKTWLDELEVQRFDWRKVSKFGEEK